MFYAGMFFSISGNHRFILIGLLNGDKERAMNKMIQSNGGFTLVELATVVLIVGILSAVTIPNYMTFALKAKNASVKTNMHTIQLGIEDFATQNEGVYPVQADEAALLAKMPGGIYPENPFTRNPTPVSWNADPAVPGEISIFNLAGGGYQIKGFGAKAVLDLCLEMGE
jgi:prepilin-type N-terminal cleavage/methylation domain-containing protein